jgi:hypothetical protein
VVLDRNIIFGLMAGCGRSECLLGCAARLRRREHGLERISRRLRRYSLVALPIDVCDVRFLVVLHPDQ